MPQHDTTTEHAVTGALANDTPSTPQQERETTTVSAALAIDKPLGFKIQGEVNTFNSASVSAAGDINGDGIADLIFGTVNNRGGDGADAAYVIFGGQLLSGTINVARVGSAAADGIAGFKIRGEAAFDRAGFSASAAGDVNGDGIDDLIVGAPRNDSGNNRAGAAYIVFGKNDTTLVDLNDVAAGIGGFKIQGQNGNDEAGNSVSGAGDVNRDGLADVIVGAPENQSCCPNFVSDGAAYVVFGKSDTALVDLDAVSAGNGGFKLQGERLADQVGFSVSGAGDVNGDGIDDVIVAGANNSGGSGAGAAYVVFGGQSWSGTINVARVG